MFAAQLWINFRNELVRIHPLFVSGTVIPNDVHSSADRVQVENRHRLACAISLYLCRGYSLAAWITAVSFCVFHGSPKWFKLSSTCDLVSFAGIPNAGIPKFPSLKGTR